MKRTEWYPPTIKPVRVGWYETRNRPPNIPECRYETYMDWWDGFAFCEHMSKNRMLEWTSVAHWRGLTEKAK